MAMMMAIQFSLLNFLCVCKCQWTHAISSNYIKNSPSPRHVIWTDEPLLKQKGPGPVSWPALELLFMLPVKGGWLTSCAAGILLYALISPLPREWFETSVQRVSASLPVLSESIGGHRGLMEDRCWEKDRKTNLGKTHRTEKMAKIHGGFLKFSLISKLRMWLGPKIEMTLDSAAHQ